MATSGYSISITALDQASAQIKKINDALKNLQKVDTANSQSANDNQNKDKKRANLLEEHTKNFAKNMHSALESIAKDFSLVGGHIGKVIGTLESSFKLPGLAIGAGLAAVGVEKLGKALADAALNATNLVAASYKANMSWQETQRAERTFYGGYGIPKPVEDATLEKVEGARRELTKTGQGREIIARHPELGNTKLSAFEWQTAAIRAFFNRTPEEIGATDEQKAQKTAEMRKVLGLEGKEFDKVLSYGGSDKAASKKFEEEIKRYEKGGLSDKAVEGLIKLEDALNHFYEKINEIRDKILSWGVDNPQLAAGAVAGGAVVAGGISAKLLQWATGAGAMIKEQQITNVILTEIAAKGVMGGGGIGVGGKISGLVKGAAPLGTLAVAGTVGVIAAAVGLWIYAFKEAFDLGIPQSEWNLLTSAAGAAKRTIGGFFGGLFGAGAPAGAAKRLPKQPAIPTAGDPRGVLDALRADATANGFNPDDVKAVGDAEGLKNKAYGAMDNGAMSYGALQMHVGGLADIFRKETGLDPSDPKNEIVMNRWGLRYAKVHGWGSWSSVTSGKVPEPRRIPTTPDALSGSITDSRYPGGDLSSVIQNTPEVLNHLPLKNYCAHLVNKGLKMLGLPPITDSQGRPSDVATDAAGYGGTEVPSNQIKKGDILLSSYGHKRGELGGHVTVATGETYIDPKTGEQWNKVTSSHTYGGGAGTEWRKDSSFDHRRRAEPLAIPSPATAKAKKEDKEADNDTNHHVNININGAPPGTRSTITGTGPATASLRTAYAMGIV